MPSLVHRVQLVDHVLVIGPRLVQLLLHLVVVDLQSAKLKFKL